MVVQKKFMNGSRGKSGSNSTIFVDGVFLFIYSHLLKKLELSKLFKKQGRKRPLDTPKRMIERRARERKVEEEI